MRLSAAWGTPAFDDLAVDDVEVVPRGPLEKLSAGLDAHEGAHAVRSASPSHPEDIVAFGDECDLVCPTVGKRLGERTAVELAFALGAAEVPEPEPMVHHVVIHDLVDDVEISLGNTFGEKSIDQVLVMLERQRHVFSFVTRVHANGLRS